MLQNTRNFYAKKLIISVKILRNFLFIFIYLIYIRAAWVPFIFTFRIFFVCHSSKLVSPIISLLVIFSSWISSNSVTMKIPSLLEVFLEIMMLTFLVDMGTHGFALHSYERFAKMFGILSWGGKGISSSWISSLKNGIDFIYYSCDHEFWQSYFYIVSNLMKIIGQVMQMILMKCNHMIQMKVTRVMWGQLT